MELNAAPGVEIEEVETANASPLEQLSSRERDVVKLVLEGQPTPRSPFASESPFAQRGTAYAGHSANSECATGRTSSWF
jgi:hypothetical protein